MRCTRCVPAAFVALVTAAPDAGSADLLLDGAEFQVNTYTTSIQRGAAARAVARAPDGRFVVVWQSLGQDGDNYGVHGQRYDGTGAPAGTEFQVNSYTTGVQDRPAVSAAADGSFVVVWASDGQDGDSRSVHGQRYDSVGDPAGTEFQVNSYTTYAQRYPGVSAAADGGFVVVWESSGQDGSIGGVQAQRYDSAGAPAGTEFQVNSYTTSAQRRPEVSVAADGGFVVVWESMFQDGGGFGVFGQRYDSAGAVAGSEFQVNTHTTSGQYRPAISTAADGDFIVVWDSLYQDGNNRGVFGQRYDSAGAAAGTEFQVNTHTTSGQSIQAVSAAADGSFLVVWESSGQDGSSSSVHGQRYDSAGAAAGTEFQVNTYTTGSQGTSNSVAVDAQGDFVVVWMSADASGYGMFGQRLCQDANANLLCDGQETTTTSTTSTTTTTVPVVAACGPTPASGCIAGAKASFQLKDNGDDTKDQLKWKLSKGGIFDQMALGNPATTRAYTLCIYDETLGVPALVGALQIDPNVKWTSKEPKGYSYVDKAGAEDGVTKAALRTGGAGKTGASVSAKGGNVPMPVPISMTEFFDEDTSVTVQLVNNETALCWTSEFTTATKNDGAQFKAKAP